MGVVSHSVMKIRFTPSDTPPRPAEVLAKYKGNIQGIVGERGRKLMSIIYGLKV